MPRDPLFDLAVTRAAAYADRLGALAPDPDPETLKRTLELWYLKTRFAYRVPLASVIEALVRWPGPGHRWEGGSEGGWTEGEPETP